jgi:hypothetical protein
VIGDYLRLAFATVLVLAPGRMVARALGLRTSSASLAFSMGSLFVAWAIVFTLHGTVWLAAAVLAVIGLAALAARGGAGRRWLARAARPAERRGSAALFESVGGRRLVFAGGVALGLALWRVAGVVTGDGLFHLARVRKLVDLGDLHLRTVDEFVNGGLHPGYAFPLWHGFLALVSALSGLDPRVVVDHETSLLAPLALVVVWEAGAALFGTAGAGIAVLAATLALYCFAAGHGGSYTSLALPATAARQILVPAAYALFFGFTASGRRAELAALALAFGAIALVHPTYALFALIPLGASALVFAGGRRRSAAALASCCVPALLVYLWLRPIVEQTLSVNPSKAAKLSSLAHYSGQLVVSSLDHYRLAASVVGRTGAVAVAALALVPLAGFAVRSRWGALVLGGSIAVLLLMLVPFLFTHFSDLVSLSQSRRAAGFLPFAFAFAGGLMLLARSLAILPLALAAGIALQLLWPGDFSSGTHGGPAAVTWFALAGGAVALGLGLLFARGEVEGRPRLVALAAALFVLPVAIHGFSRWSALTPSDPDALSPALISELARLPARAVVIASPATSYEILADAPVYVVAAPLVHVANTRANDPSQRIAAVELWLKTGDPSIPRRYGATWAVRGVGATEHLYHLSR